MKKFDNGKRFRIRIPTYETYFGLKFVSDVCGIWVFKIMSFFWFLSGSKYT